MSEPTVSVVIPAYNAAATITETINSVFTQTRPADEVIVVDDGSNDGTSAVLSKWEHSIRIIRQHNLGRASACNRGVREAGGELIAFVDADDLWLPHKLERQLTAHRHNAMSYTDAVHFGPHGETRKGDVCRQPSGRILEPLLLDNFITGSSVLIRRDVFLDCGGFDESYNCLQDWPLWLKIAAKHNINHVPEPLVRYRLHEGQTTRNVHSTLAAHRRVLDEAFADGGSASHLRHMQSQAYANAHQCVAWSALIAGDSLMAMRCSAYAMRYQPFNTSHWKQLARSVASLVSRP